MDTQASGSTPATSMATRWRSSAPPLMRIAPASRRLCSRSAGATSPSSAGRSNLHLQALAIDHYGSRPALPRRAAREQFRTGGACYDEFRRLKSEGLVRRLVVEVFPWTSKISLDALRGGWPGGVIDGYIFYLNPLQRFASNELFAEIQRQNQPIIALRTVGGGNVHRLRDMPGDSLHPPACSRGRPHLRAIRLQELDGVLRPLRIRHPSGQGHRRRNQPNRGPAGVPRGDQGPQAAPGRHSERTSSASRPAGLTRPTCTRALVHVSSAPAPKDRACC